jgi:hypothetical protein
VKSACVGTNPTDEPITEDYRTFLALSVEAVCFFRLLLSFDNAWSFLAAHASQLARGTVCVQPKVQPDRTGKLWHYLGSLGKYLPYSRGLLTAPMQATIIPRGVPIMPRQNTAKGASKRFSAVCLALLLCSAAATTGCNNYCVSGVINPPTGTIQVNTCPPSQANATVRISIHPSATSSTESGSIGFRHIFVTIIGIEASSEVPAEWQELAPDLERNPVQIDLVGCTLDDCASPSFAETLVPAGVYHEVRLRFAPQQLADGSLAPEKNKCGNVGLNCAVTADGEVRPLTLDLSTPEVRITSEQIAGGFFRVLPDTATDLAIVFNGNSPRGMLLGKSVHLDPVFNIESSTPP